MGSCSQEFTPGQVELADKIFYAVLYFHYQNGFCNNLIEKVEIEGSSIGLDRTRLEVDTDFDVPFKTMVNSTGEFSGKVFFPTPITKLSGHRYLDTKWVISPNTTTNG